MKALSILAGMALAAPSPPHDVIRTQVQWGAIVSLSCALGRGTAFHIGNGRYVTAWHVLRISGGGCKIDGEPVRVLREDAGKDVAEIVGPVRSTRIAIDCAPLKPGRHYLGVGYAGVSRLHLPLIYSLFGDDPENGNAQFVGPDTIPGMSGGPLLGKDLNASGVVLQRHPSRARALSETFFCDRGRP